jgi:hypothetical protein
MRRKKCRKSRKKRCKVREEKRIPEGTLSEKGSGRENKIKIVDRKRNWK